MIGVLLTSTCYCENIDKNMYRDRIEELVNNILTLEKHIHQPFEMIIADNSPADYCPTEKILKFRPRNTLFIRETDNPGKSVGEATLIRDGVNLSYARGHEWLLKISGRYFLTDNWSLDETVSYLEQMQKPLYIHLEGSPFRDMKWAKAHPLYDENINNDKILISASTQAFVAKPEYLLNNQVFKNDFLYKENEWVNFEQLFWRAIRNLDFLYWPELPIDGFEHSKAGNISVKKRANKMRNSIFETTTDYKSIPQIDVSQLIV